MIKEKVLLCRLTYDNIQLLLEDYPKQELAKDIGVAEEELQDIYYGFWVYETIDPFNGDIPSCEIKIAGEVDTSWFITPCFGKYIGKDWKQGIEGEIWECVSEDGLFF